MNGSKKKIAAASALAIASAGLVAGMATSSATASDSVTQGVAGGTETRARLVPLNNSGVAGGATVNVDGRDLDIRVNARRLVRGMPHAQHIHFGARAANECPTVRLDSNKDHRLNTAEGLPAYGPVRVSFTTRGATGPGSALAVNRFPTADNGRIRYERQTTTRPRIAQGIRDGEAVVVIHGIDYNHNGKYDFRGAGKSELDPSLPAEATDPVTCGVLRVQDTLN
jgi:hypothetical protein